MPFFNSSSGRSYYRRWQAADPRAVLVFLHGFGEHSGLYHRFAAELGNHGIEIWALDHAGHGLSPGERGHVGTLTELTERAGALTELARAAQPELPQVIAGHSLGSVAALLTALERPGAYATAVLSGAPLSPLEWIQDTQQTTLDLDPAALSADPNYLDQLEHDPPAFTTADVLDTLRSLLPAAWQRFADELPKLELPVLVVQGERDEIAPPDGVRAWAERMPTLRLDVISGAAHDVLNDVSHREVADRVATFVTGRVSGAAAGEAVGTAAGAAVGTAAGEAVGAAAGEAVGIAAGAATENAAGQPAGPATPLGITPQERAAIARLLDFPLLTAINGRRSRRFPVGGEIPTGELAYASRQPIQPLSETERAIVIATVTGVTGWNFGITHHPEYAPALPNYSGAAAGRSYPSAAGFHTSDFFFTDDSGTYFVSTRDAGPDGEVGADGTTDVDQWLAATVARYRQLSERRIHLPRSEPYLEGHNTWIANHPGSLLIIPVADLAQHLIANLAFFLQNGYGIYDDVHDRPVPGADDPSLRHAGDPFPLSFVEQYTLAEASAELMTSVYNGHLVLGALGLGGWAFDGINRLSMLGASGDPDVPGLGFHVQQDERWSLPNPTGLPGVFETLSRPHVRDATEAVERFVERKFGAGGPFHADTAGPWRDNPRVRGSAAPYDDRFRRLLTAQVAYLDETFGKLPGTVPTVHIMNYLQAQHLDTEFYDRHFGPGAYLPTHRDHQRVWH